LKRRVGHRQAGFGRQALELGAAEAHLEADGGFPLLEQPGRGDVVVVHQLGFVARGQRVEDGAPDRRLVEKPAVLRCPTEVDDRVAEVRDIGG